MDLYRDLIGTMWSFSNTRTNQLDCLQVCKFDHSLKRFIHSTTVEEACVIILGFYSFHDDTHEHLRYSIVFGLDGLVFGCWFSPKFASWKRIL